MDTVYKTFRAEVKGVNEDTGEVDMFIPVSSRSVDRDGEVVEPIAFEATLPEFMKRPVLVASHDYHDLTNQIGEWSSLKAQSKGIKGKPKYYINEGNEQADWGFKLAKKGMAAFSIGFIPKVWEDGDGVKEPRRTYKEIELLEISQVIVPSNRDAIQSIRSKSVDPIITKICDEVEKELPEVKKPKEVSQEEIKDEIDYLTLMIDEVGLSEEAEESLRELMKRLPADDIAVKDMTCKIELTGIPEFKEVLTEAQQIIDDDRLKLIIEQTVKNVIKEIK
jgi:HK97 family phage prohead protease